MKYNRRHRGYKGYLQQIFSKLSTPKVKSIIEYIGSTIGICSFIGIIGMAGSIEQDNISLGEGILHIIMRMIIMVIGFIMANAFITYEEDEDNDEEI